MVVYATLWSCARLALQQAGEYFYFHVRLGLHNANRPTRLEPTGSIELGAVLFY